jgi:PBSX family phage terminase large subunit
MILMTPAQNKIAQSKARFRVICCGRRFGKTTEAVEEIKGCAVYKEARIAYIAPTYQQARDIAWAQLRNELSPIIKECNESRLELSVLNKLGKRSQIFLRGWESIETLRGQKFDLLILDEVAMMRNFWTNWHEVLRPTLTDTRGEAMFISTPKGFNHFYDLYNLEARDEDFKSFHFTSFDNPYLPVDELLKAKKELPEDKFAQEYMADFRKTEGLVYKEFDRAKHIYDTEPTRIIEKLGGVDFGFTNPAAIVTAERDADNHYWISNVWYKTGQTEAQVAEVVAGKHLNKCYPDPESPGGIQELKNRGVNVREVIKGKDSIKTGIDAVRELLKSGRLHIHKSCEDLVWEMEIYSYPDKKDMHNLDENPIKENDHALDALRYIMMMQGEAQSRAATQYIPKSIVRRPNNSLHYLK